MNLQTLYGNRFSEEDRRWKAAVWRILWRKVFRAHVRPADVVVDLGAGYCDFINAVEAARRIAVDLNPETKASAAAGVETHEVDAAKMSFLADATVDVVFSSNFLEHLPDKQAVMRVLEECRRVLKPAGKLVLIGPNIRYLPGLYWDYFDHHVALTERSVAEVLDLVGFDVVHVESRFLPYTVKSRLPRWEWLVSGYLSVRRLAGPLLGKQFYVVAHRRA